MSEDDYNEEYDLPDDEGDVTEYGYTSNLWLAKAMIYMADEMDLKYAVAALLDHMHKIGTPTIDVELVRETMVQVTATGVAMVYTGIAKEQITEEEIAAFEAQMRGTPTAEKTERWVDGRVHNHDIDPSCKESRMPNGTLRGECMDED